MVVVVTTTAVGLLARCAAGAEVGSVGGLALAPAAGPSDAIVGSWWLYARDAGGVPRKH